MVSGESSTAKSLFTSFMIGSYLRRHKHSYAVFFETEGATVTSMAKSIGIPEDRMVILPVTTVEECRTQMVKILDQILDNKKANEEKMKANIKAFKAKNKKATKKELEKFITDSQQELLGFYDRFIFCVDSLGMLSTHKETTDVASGDDKKDMTRAGLLKGWSRVTSLKLSIAQIPLLVVNHTYATFDTYDPRAASGGSGPAYMSDVHLMLFKSKEKEGKTQVGVKIRLNVKKSRFMIENQNVYIVIHFKKGLYRMSHLVDLAYETLGVFKKDKNSFVLPDGTKAAMHLVRSQPSKYLNQTVLDAINKAAIEHYGFGDLDPSVDIEDELAHIDDKVAKAEADAEEMEFDGYSP